MTVAALIPVGPVTVRLISEGDRIVGSLKDRGPFEPESLAKWAELCVWRSGTVLDVGAYTGLYSIAARLLKSHTIAFEPMRFNRERFRGNALLNSVSSACNEEAVSDEVGEAVFNWNPIPYTAGGSLMRRRAHAASNVVRTLTIDSLNLQSVAAIKIDVERAEPLVLAGARETLARCRPALLVEVLGDVEKAAVLAAVEGYQVEATLDVRNWLMLPT